MTLETIIVIAVILICRILAGVFDALMDARKDGSRLQGLGLCFWGTWLHPWYDGGVSIWECLYAPGVCSGWMKFKPGSILGWRADFWHMAKYWKEIMDSLAICTALYLVFGWWAYVGIPLILFAEGRTFSILYARWI